MHAELRPDLDEIFNQIVSGKPISRDLAFDLIQSNDPGLFIVASKLRDFYKSNIITYSRKVFINLVNLCRDTCSYCTYKKEPSEPSSVMMTSDQVIAIAKAGMQARCTEALFITGERPEQKYYEARQWLKVVGHKTTPEYIAELSQIVLDKTGLLPHTNAGNLNKKEMILLKKTNVSIGLMLESTSEELLKPGKPHHRASSKNPRIRIKTLQCAGELKIPTTTGLLIGIGENHKDIIDSLFVISDLHKKFGHIQEVIMQNFAPKPMTAMSDHCSPSSNYFLKCIAIARLIMPSMNIQVPPNLSPGSYSRYIDAGINDWGGISPITIDHVNPEFAWPKINEIKYVTEKKGYKLRARLPVYPEFIKNEFIPHELKRYVKLLCENDGLVPEEFIN